HSKSQRAAAGHRCEAQTSGDAIEVARRWLTDLAFLMYVHDTAPLMYGPSAEAPEDADLSRLWLRRRDVGNIGWSLAPRTQCLRKSRAVAKKSAGRAVDRGSINIRDASPKPLRSRSASASPH